MNNKNDNLYSYILEFYIHFGLAVFFHPEHLVSFPSTRFRVPEVHIFKTDTSFFFRAIVADQVRCSCRARTPGIFRTILSELFIVGSPVQFFSIGGGFIKA